MRALLDAGLAALQQGDLAAALSAYQRAFSADPDSAEACEGLGVVALHLNKGLSAIRLFAGAVQRAPEGAGPRSNLGLALYQEGRLAEAEASLREAVERGPSWAPAHHNLGITLDRQHRYPEAAGELREAVRLDPAYVKAESALLSVLATLCEWEELEARQVAVESAIKRALEAGRDPGVQPFHALAQPFSLDTLLALTRRASRRSAERVGCWPPLEHALDGGERLRVGYFSPDLSEHAVGFLMQDLLERHDRSRLHVTCYSLRRADDGVRRRIERACDRFVDLTDAGDRAAACAIQADGTQVLVDLAGYTSRARLEVLAQRPAPVQCQFLGYPGTLAADFVDYRITDRTTVPPWLEHAFSERLVLLPAPFAVPGWEVPEQAPSRAGLGLPDDGCVFAYLNATYRIDRPVFEAWMRILAAVEGAVLWLRADHERVPDALRRRAGACGVDPARLVFTTVSKLSEDWIHRAADVWLDTLTLSSGTATILCAWVGLPVLTVAGDRPHNRTGAALVTAAGAPELAVETLAEYEKLAVELGRDAGRREELRRRLLAGHGSAPLFSPDRFVRSLERAFEAMWDAHRYGRPPATMEVTEP